MLIIKPDFDRRIDLPGVGPCRRPVDIDQAKSGLNKLVSLRVYSFAKDMVIDGEAEDDEVFIALMRGRADIAVSSSGRTFGAYSLRIEGGSRVVYLPAHASYRLSAVDDCDIAYARVRPDGSQSRAPRVFASADQRLLIPDYATEMGLALTTLPAGEATALTASDGSSPERFVHLRTDNGGAASIAGERIGNWGSLVLSDGERATIEIEKGTVDILTICASAH